jgi:hypothetical protein
MAIKVGLDLLPDNMYECRRMNGKAGEVYRKKTYGPITNDDTTH